MDWYAIWDEQRDLPRRQHPWSLALRAIAGASIAGGLIALWQAGWPGGLLPLCYGMVGGIVVAALALGLDTLILATRLLYAWHRAFLREASAAQEHRERIEKREAA